MKKLLAVMAAISILMLAGCAKKPESSAQVTTTTQQSTIEILDEYDQWDVFFGGISGVGTDTDYDESCKKIADVAKDNVIDRAFLKEMDDYSKTKWTLTGQSEIVVKYANLWKAEWDASDKRILKLIQDESLNEGISDDRKRDYASIKEAYENNKNITEQYIESQYKTYNTIWSENLSRDNLFNAYVMLMNLNRKAALNSFQIENCLSGDFEFVYGKAD